MDFVVFYPDLSKLFEWEWFSIRQSKLISLSITVSSYWRGGFTFRGAFISFNATPTLIDKACGCQSSVFLTKWLQWCNCNCFVYRSKIKNIRCEYSYEDKYISLTLFSFIFLFFFIFSLEILNNLSSNYFQFFSFDMWICNFTIVYQNHKLLVNFFSCCFFILT